MLHTIFSAYRALLFPVLLSWIRGRADVQSLKALGSQRQRLTMVSCKKPKMGRALCGCGESQGTQRQWNGCVCDCGGTGNRQGECVWGTRLGFTQHPIFPCTDSKHHPPVLGRYKTAGFFRMGSYNQPSQQCSYFPPNANQQSNYCVW